MACIPDSSGCERLGTDAFVEHLNRGEGTQYEYIACLDVLHRNNPQPESLYKDLRTGGSLVIERKSVSWPLNYLHHHSNDHFVASQIFCALSSIQFPDLYVLEILGCVEGRKEDLSAFAREVAKDISALHSGLKHNQVIKGSSFGHRWSFRIQPSYDRDAEGPKRGVIISWNSILEESFLDTENLPIALGGSITKIHDACIRKFSNYSDARRILVLDTYGDLRYKTVGWWSRFFEKVPPPTAIGEIWLGIHDFVNDLEQGWMFDRVLVHLPSI